MRPDGVGAIPGWVSERPGLRSTDSPRTSGRAPTGEENLTRLHRQQAPELDGGIQPAEEFAGVEGDQTRNGRVGTWPGAGIARSCGALTPVALRAPSVSAPQELLTLLRRGTSYFALTVLFSIGVGVIWDGIPFETPVIPAKAGMTATCNAHVSQMTPVPKVPDHCSPVGFLVLSSRQN